MRTSLIFSTFTLIGFTHPTILERVIVKNRREPSLLPPIPAAGYASNPEEL
jgi:hypothetical protein